MISFLRSELSDITDMMLAQRAFLHPGNSITDDAIRAKGLYLTVGQMPALLRNCEFCK